MEKAYKFRIYPNQKQEVIIQKTFDMNLYEAIYYEYYLHNINIKNKYNANIRFGGNSECFSDIKYFDDKFYSYMDNYFAM